LSVGSSGSGTLVKLTLPSPVPMVSTPQCFTSRMKGSSLRPCTTASLCISTSIGSAPSVSMRRHTAVGRWKAWLSQSPGRFCAPRAMEPSGRMSPGQPMPMKGASRIFLRSL
jgi:hypothetical protein